MSTPVGEMSRPFLADLRRLDSELPVPLPERLRFLRELEYDLEAFCAGLLARGFAAEDARRLALEELLPDPTTLRDLARIHAPTYRRLTASLSADRLRLVERGVLALATASVLVVQTSLLLRVEGIVAPSAFLWPVLGVGGLLFAACSAKAFRLWIAGDHRAPRRGLGAILALCGLALGIGCVGVLLDTYAFAASMGAGPGDASALALDWLLRESILLAAAVLVALAGALAWFVLSLWVTGVSAARRELLGLTHIPDEEVT